MSKSQALTEAMSAIIANKKTTFFASYLMQQMQVIHDPNTKTASCDGKTIRVGPWFDGLNLRQRVFVLLHEIMHGVLDHMPRSELYRARGFGMDLLPFSHGRANVAMDWVINALITEANIGEMPSGGLFRSRADAQRTWDDLYLEADEPPPDDGSQPGAFRDEHLPPPPGSKPDSAQHKQALTQARNAAKAVGAMPGNLERLIGEILDPTQPWPELVRDFMTNCAGRDEVTWRKLNRRRLVTPPGLAFPGRDGHQIDCVVVAVDVSGSIGERELTLFISELGGIVIDLAPRELHILWWDTEAEHVLLEDGTLDDLEQLHPNGGGGTRYDCVPRKIAELEIEPSVVVCLTDGYVMWPSSEDILWPHITVCTSDEQAPFGKTIKLEV